MIAMSICFTIVTFSLYACISKHQVLNSKYIQQVFLKHFKICDTHYVCKGFKVRRIDLISNSTWIHCRTKLYPACPIFTFFFFF